MGSEAQLDIVSADSHVVEPADLWTTRLAGSEWADQAPHVVEDPAGGQLFVVEGALPFPVALAGSAGKDSADIRPMGVPRAELRAGGWDPVARLEDMDTDGIAAEVLYPSAGLALLQSPDPSLQLAAAKVYNDWLVEFCSAGRGRLAGLALVPTVDPEAAASEVHRAADRGLLGVIVPGVAPEGHYAEARYDGFWAACAERRLPVSFHILPELGGGSDPTLGSGIMLMTIMSVVHIVQQSLALLIFGGVFDRHPDLRVVSAEHDAGWVAHFAHRLAQMHERHVGWLGFGATLARRPDEYLASNVWYTFQKDPVAVATRDRVGTGQLMWASDYPHADSTWPCSREVIGADFAGVPSEDAAAILGGNARALYGIDVA